MNCSPEAFLLGVLSGQKRDFSVDELQKLIGVDKRGLRILKERLLDLGHPIGSHHDRGYFYIRTVKDRDDAIEKYQAQAKTELKRAMQISEAFENTYRRLNLFERSI